MRVLMKCADSALLVFNYYMYFVFSWFSSSLWSYISYN